VQPGEAASSYSVDVQGSTAVQVGRGNTQVNNFYGAAGAGQRPAARSVYLLQVEELSPYALVGRDTELAGRWPGGAPSSWPRRS
jgi:hypothetical protein